jgi:conjugal transfer mating pair stabilization protein TraG
MFEIISLGRMDFMLAVLNGLAILTADDGPAGYGGLVALGLLIGVVLALLRGIVTQKLELQYVLGGWLLFACLFVPKVTVTVEDIYTGETQTVANVPLGPAAIGSITSTIGVTLADAFGTVFAVPSLTTTGYMDSLELINAMRTMDYGAANDGDAANALNAVDLQRSMRAYLIDCVYYDMAMDLPVHDVTAAELRESADLLTSIEVNSNTWFTTVYLIEGDQDGQTLTCAEAYTQLSSFVRTRFLPAWETYIASLLGLTDTSTQMQDALDAIFGVGRDAQTYMLNALIKRELELAEVGYHAQADNSAGVLMRVQAMEQRRTQWAAEQSLWAEMARPAIAFIEGFFYAVSPFMGFLFTLGAPGITLFARYLLLAVWIQLWMPVLAVTNLYITIAASNDLQRIAAGGTDPLTIVGLDSVWTETASWLAFGGSMVAATPLLTLILITGSYFALTRLTDRLAGADHVDERIQSPDIMAPAAIAATGAMGMQTASYTSDPMHGLHRTGLPNVLPSVNFSSDIRSSVQSAHAAQEQAAKDWNVAFSSGLDLSSQRGREQFISNLNSTGLSSSFSQSDAVVQRMAQSAMEAVGTFRNWSQEDRDQIVAAIGGAVQGGQGAQGRASIDAALSNVRSLSDTQRKEIGDRIEKMVGANSDEMVQLSEKVQQDASEGLTSRFFTAMRMEDATKWSEAQRDSKSASEAFERADALSRASALRQDIKIQAIGYQSSTQGWDDELLRLVSTHRLDMSEVEDNAGYWSRQGLMDHDTARASAAALALAEGPHAARVALAETLAEHGFGTPRMELNDPLRGQAIEDRAITSGEATDAVWGELSRLSPAMRSSLRDDVGYRINSEADLDARGRAAAVSFFEAKKEGNAEKVQSALSEFDRVINAQRAAHFESTFEETRGFLRAVQDFDLAGQFGDFEINTNALKEAGSAFHSAYGKALEASGDPNVAVGAGIAASWRGYGKGFDEAVDARRERAYQEALALGFPSAAAQFYADQNMLWQEPIDDSISKMTGNDGQFEEVKAQTRELLGDKAYAMLSRAATAEPVAKKHYLDGALSIYRQRQEIAEEAVQ